MRQQLTQTQTLWILLAVFALLWFGNLDYRHLVKPDEGRYAEIAREMALSGDWITPRLNGIKYFEKPPFQYWATAAAFQTFGVNEWTARLWTALAGFLGVLAVWFAGSRLYGERAGLYAALFLGSNLYYVLLGHINTLDMGLTLFLTAALAAFLLGQRAPLASRAERNWMLLTWIAMGFAVLSKGLVGIVIPAAVLVLYSAMQRQFSLWRRLYFGYGLLAFLAVTAPWFYAVSKANPEFAYFFFVHEHWLRYTTHIHRRDEPIWYFLPVLSVGLLPWIFTAFSALWQTSRVMARELTEFATQHVLLVWCAFVFVFFSLSGSKLPDYILPMFPALALLTGSSLAAVKSRLLQWNILASALVSLAVLAAIPFALDAFSSQGARELYRNYAYWIAAAMLSLTAGCCVAIFLCWRARTHEAIVALAFAGLIAAQIGLSGHETLASSNSSYYLAQQIKPQLRLGVPFYSVKMYDQTLPFYLGRTLTLVHYTDEFEYGLQQQPEKAIPTMAEFETRWRGEGAAFAVMEPAVYDELRQYGLPARLVARDLRRVIIATP